MELRQRWPARDPEALARIETVCLLAGFVLAVVAVGARPVLARVGLAYGPSMLVAWLAAEAVAFAGLIAWIEGAPVDAFLVGAVVEVVLMMALFPTRLAAARHDRR